MPHASKLNSKRLKRLRDLVRNIQPQKLSLWSRHKFAGMDPSRLSSILRKVEQGELEEWADLVSFMLRNDGHVGAVYDVRMQTVAGADWKIEPGEWISPPSFLTERQETELAETGAALCENALKASGHLERWFAHLLHAEGLGWSVLAHDWQREGDLYVSRPKVVHPRDVRFAQDWTPEIRTHGEEGSQWVRTDDYPSQAFVIHTPGNIAETPNLSGDLMRVAWAWLLKRWALVFKHRGIERFAVPHLIGRIDPNADPEVQEAMYDSLNNLTSESVLLVWGDTSTIEYLETGSDAGATILSDAIRELNAEISKGIIGSTLNIEIGDTGGNRAAAESQAQTTILPQNKADAGRLASTIGEQWFKPLLEFNRHLFPGGIVPPVPRLKFSLLQEEASNPLVGLVDVAVRKGQVRGNELRAMIGLPPEEQGEEFMAPELDDPANDNGLAGQDFGESSEASFARIEHTTHGEWRVLSPDGESVAVHATKVAAMASLRAYERLQRHGVHRTALGSLEISKPSEGQPEGFKAVRNSDGATQDFADLDDALEFLEASEAKIA